MSELAAEERFKAWECALFELAGLRREGPRAFHRLGEVLRRVRDQRLYLERYASFGRFLSREVGLPRSEAEALVRAAELFDEGEAAELGREKVLMLAKLPERELRRLMAERFESRDHSGAVVQRSVFGLAGIELEQVLRRRGQRPEPAREDAPRAATLQAALDAAAVASPFTAIEPGAAYVVRDAAGAVVEQRQTIDLLGVEVARLPQVLAALAAAARPQAPKRTRPKRVGRSATAARRKRA